MSKEEQKLKNDKSIGEIVEILTYIEQKVDELHKCSSDDFIMLNSYLKKQYNQIEIVSENVTNVFELLAGNENQQLSNRLEAFAHQFIKGIDLAEKEFSSNITALEQVLSDINLLYIPVKNFVQNTVTLNFLTNSLKFNIVYYDRKNNKLLDDEIENFRKYILDLKKISSSIEDTGIQIKTSSGVIFAGARKMKESNGDNAAILTEKINVVVDVLKQKYNDGLLKIPELKDKQENHSESIGKIITNLQYSDIIRQKIEHIQDAHRDMIAKLNNLKGVDNELFSENFDKHMIQIRDISDLQTAQLVRTNKEYQNAVEVITSKFVEIGNGIDKMTKDIIRFSGQSIVSEHVYFDFYNTENMVETLLELTRQFVEENVDIAQEGNNLQNHLQILESNFERLKIIGENIQKQVETINTKTENLIGKGYDLGDILKQIQNVYSSAEQNLNNVSKYFDQTKDTSKELDFENKRKKYGSFSDYKDEIKLILNEISKNNRIISKILTETDNLQDKISAEIKDAIKQIKYYDFYEKTADEIIVKLRLLYETISFSTEYETSELKEENLEERKLSYTMKSERITHENVVHGDDQKNKKEEEDDEIEFF